MLVERALCTAIGATGNNGLNAGRFQMSQDRVGIVSFVGRQTTGLQFAKQRQCFGTVACVPTGQSKAREHGCQRSIAAVSVYSSPVIFVALHYTNFGILI